MTENVTITRAELARMIDHTLLAPEATDADVTRLAQEAGRLGAGAVCVSPSRLPLAPGALATGIAVAAVAGFPSGAHLAPVKAAEAAAAVAAGATEIDMVIDLGLALEDRWKPVTAEVAAVRAAIGPGVVLKVILETAVIGPGRIGPACQAAEAGGADFVKTSTGYHKAGGATVEAVAAMAAAVGGRLGVKASGGIRTADDALKMIAAGATRIGASATAAILDGLPAELRRRYPTGRA
jgi:deoxyribose-phosphate aldolase